MTRWCSVFLLMGVMAACGGNQAPTETPTALLDQDQDGYQSSEDCDDSDAQSYPGAPEICDEFDNDCDSLVDEGARNTYYLDNDGDGYGSDSISACNAQGSLVEVGGDCNENDPNINPGMIESCASTGGTAPDIDGIDNDCDSSIDEDLLTTWYIDGDGDGYGDPNTTASSCEQPLGYIAQGGDCDDLDASVNPSAEEVCGGEPVDEDCDGLIDTDDPDLGELTTYFRDRDEDGFGNPNIPSNDCLRPEGYVENAEDCDDNNADAYPGAPEVCDAVDNDCDQQIDDDDADLTGAIPSYADTDQDGYGADDTQEMHCITPDDQVSIGGDCDDTLNTVYPGALEYCDSPASGKAIDNDCDGEADEASAVDAHTYYSDIDGDTQGDPNQGITACLAPAGTVPTAFDCDDSDPTVSSGLMERLGTGLDEDCDGIVDEGIYDDDLDGDGFPGHAGDGQLVDCNDRDPTRSPGIWEVFGDGIDNDCDGKIDADFYVLRSGQSPEIGKPLFPTIQGAIDAAQGGQLIAVGPGTYLENIDFLGKNITLYAMEGPIPTLIEGSRGGPVVKFTSGEQDAQLIGFSLIGGDGVGCPNASENGGGGICIIEASPTIRGNIIVQNDAAQGGGIYALGMHGRIEDNLIRLNTTRGVGGGLYLERSNAAVWNNEISDNSASLDGGGLYISLSSPSIRKNIIVENSSFLGAGLLVDTCTGVFTHNAIRGNHASGWGGGLAGTRDKSAFVNNIVAGNSAAMGGGGIRLYNSESRIHHLTCVSNTASFGGCLSLEGIGNDDLAFSIFAFNQALDGANVSLALGATEPVAGSNAYYLPDAQDAGLDNLSTSDEDFVLNPRFENDPEDGLWEDDDYHLKSNSPVKDVRAESSFGSDPDGSPGDLGGFGGPLAPF